MNLFFAVDEAVDEAVIQPLFLIVGSRVPVTWPGAAQDTRGTDLAAVLVVASQPARMASNLRSSPSHKQGVRPSACSFWCG